MNGNLALFVGLAVVSLGPVSSPAADTDVRVMSFNIRYGTARDGDNHWDKRRDFVVETIRAFNPDLLGTQETLGFQRDFLARALSEYDSLGVGRDDGQDKGEMMALFYRRERFEKLDAGHFWLSTTPDVPGSKSWDSSLPRMVTWVRLRDRRRPQSPPVCFFNTHFDHQGPTARLESARLIVKELQHRAEGASVILTGDFNSGEASPPYQALFPADGRLVDTFRANRPDRTKDEGTFSGFKPDAVDGARIDWIGVSRDWQIRSARIDRTAREGRTPSDHFPVTAVLRHELNLQGQRPASAPVLIVSEPGFDVRAIRDMDYCDGKDADRHKHRLDLYLPRRAEKFPVVFFIHGGAWTTGDRKLYGPLGRAIARHGIGAVVISYRLSPGVQHPEHIRDVAAAFAWTHRHISEYGGSPDQIFVAGQSAGGHLAALLGTDVTYLQEHGLSLKDVRGVIPISGIYRFPPGRYRMLLGPGRNAAANASPITHVSGDEPPFLILYADSDLPPCKPMSHDLHQALKNKQVAAECEAVEDRNHLTIIFQPMIDRHDSTLQRMLRFIAQETGFPLRSPSSAAAGTEIDSNPPK